MPDIRQARLIVTEQYPGASWKKRVRLMSDVQVLRIYLAMKQRGQVAR